MSLLSAPRWSIQIVEASDPLKRNKSARPWEHTRRIWDAPLDRPIGSTQPIFYEGVRLQKLSEGSLVGDGSLCCALDEQEEISFTHEISVRILDTSASDHPLFDQPLKRQDGSRMHFETPNGECKLLARKGTGKLRYALVLHTLVLCKPLFAIQAVADIAYTLQQEQLKMRILISPSVIESKRAYLKRLHGEIEQEEESLRNLRRKYDELVQHREQRVRQQDDASPAASSNDHAKADGN